MGAGRDLVIGEVLSVGAEGVRAAVYGRTEGFARGDLVERADEGLSIIAGPALLGRVLDGLGRPMDDGPRLVGDRLGIEGSTPTAASSPAHP